VFETKKEMQKEGVIFLYSVSHNQYRTAVALIPLCCSHCYHRVLGVLCSYCGVGTGDNRKGSLDLFL